MQVSTLYHSIRASSAKALFRRLDHCAIYLLIAGTHTPFSLVTLRGSLGWTLFATIWAMAAYGIVHAWRYETLTISAPDPQTAALASKSAGFRHWNSNPRMAASEILSPDGRMSTTGQVSLVASPDGRFASPST
jgi:hypothetical protein